MIEFFETYLNGVNADFLLFFKRDYDKITGDEELNNDELFEKLSRCFEYYEFFNDRSNEI